MNSKASNQIEVIISIAGYIVSYVFGMAYIILIISDSLMFFWSELMVKQGLKFILNLHNFLYLSTNISILRYFSYSENNLHIFKRNF